ncbi:MAG: hypothetical protein ACR2MN_05800 [Acidimicrobiales bacterium]
MRSTFLAAFGRGTVKTMATASGPSRQGPAPKPAAVTAWRQGFTRLDDSTMTA